MKKEIIYFFIFCLQAQFLHAQSLWKNSAKTAYILYGRHIATNYIVDSGKNNLVSRKTPISLEAGFMLDFALNNKFALRTGLSGHLHFWMKRPMESRVKYPMCSLQIIPGLF